MKERKTFTFDGENSADYGLYISGDSVYNAPNREIDMVSIPGRNGQLAIDLGRYENITVTYPAFVFADTQEEFREKIRRIRNWLCSKTSYQRLTDEYNPESFRLGLYKSGLEVEPIFYNRCGEFEMSFDCKPQRFLFTGEEVFTLGEWGETETYSGSIVSFEGTETTAIKTLNANIVPKQSGSGDPSPSNVRPISGFTNVNVNVAGGMIFDPSTQGTMGEAQDAGWWINSSTSVIEKGGGSNKTFAIPCKPQTEYYFEFDGYTGIFRIAFGKMADLSFIDSSDWQNVYNIKAFNENGRRTWATESPTDATYLFIQIGSAQFSTDKLKIKAYEIAESESIPLGQTVYGGTLEVMSGKLTIDRGSIDMGATTWIYGNGGFYANMSTVPITPKALFNGICSCYKYGGAYNVCQNNQFGYIFNSVPYVKDSRYTDATAFKTAMSGQTMVIELATPTEITLTPTQVKTLLGNNNIFADSGDVTVEIGENPYILVNPTKFEATPIFEVEGSGTLSVGDTTLTINNDGTTIIDTEMMEAYEDDNGAIISRNDDVEGGFPTLTSGINNVEADGLTSVKVTPKWWEL